MTDQIVPPDGHIDETNIETRGKSFALEFNPDEYRHHFEDTSLSDTEIDEFMATLWQIMVGFVDLGFGIEATQQALANTLIEDLNEKGEKTECSSDHKSAKR
ncbi:MAG: hypothetical protein OIF58_02885 [Cohaesibacter sp.]|nr:hypothetical protein [Cohaesibacter sp.]